MKIDKDQIAETFIAGKTEDGRNVVYVATHGGLHAFFCKDKDGNVSAIGAAPHKAISRFLAEKKEPGIKWGEEFGKSEQLEKSEDQTFVKLRTFMFSEAPLQKNEPSDIYVVYDVSKQEISFMKKEEIIEGLKNKTLNKYVLARDLSCSINATCITHIPDFEGVE